MQPHVDVLIPTYRRPAALAVTLAGLCSQTLPSLHIVLSDQTEDNDAWSYPEVMALVRILKAHGREVTLLKHQPRLGLAEHRQFLLSQAAARYALFLDDDIFLEPDAVARMLATIEGERCGFVGCAPIGLSFLDDERPHQQKIEFWEGPVEPERIHPGSAAWERHHLHSAANIWHVQRRLGLTAETQRTYRLAWVGGCVLFDVKKLRDAGGFDFWTELPPSHCGEDVLAELRVMARYGGCGLIPSGSYHLELPTTVPDREVNAPEALEWQA